ncbi:Vacuolar sorting protein 18 [Camellia lanceoleosa]|uniref:Vacuolar sorting protein 18 n=1 Tax=Camellia lanceoleosa TaxID=1840588 RepID=A0ACC0GSS2_9ERIC|nr:Vacuolar sorting protein 18 [Camellia lanceoleosa]
MDYPWEAICSSLEDYNKQIEQLKQEMNNTTHGADNIRNDISVLAQRYAVIDCDEDCGVCQRKILTAGWDHRMARGYTSVGAMAPFLCLSMWTCLPCSMPDFPCHKVYPPRSSKF